MSNILAEDVQSLQTPSNFQFSGVDINDLGASEYTLATIVLDVSSSVSAYKNELTNCIKTIVESCKKSPRSENLLVRLVTFNQHVNERHGFKLLETINLNDYDTSVNPRGATALYDAIQSSVEATQEYGKLLSDQDYFANGVVYVITDGEDNRSRCTPSTIHTFLEQCKRDEEGLESLCVILIGIGYSNDVLKGYLDALKDTASLDQFVDMTEMFSNSHPENALAKLAGYISRSISTTSMALQNGSSSPASSMLIF